MFAAIENYAAQELGIVGTPTINIIANNDVEAGSIIAITDVYEVRVEL